MAEPKYVIKKDQTEGSVLSYQPRALGLDLQDAAKSYLKHQAEKKSDFRLSELIAKQTGVADVENEVYRSRIEAEVLLKLKELQENAYQEAFNLGKEEGIQKAFDSKKAELDNLSVEFSAAIEQIRTLRTEIIKAKETEIIELVFLIGKKIALREVNMEQSIIKDLLTQLLDEAESDEEVKVHLSQDDYTYVMSQLESGDLKLKDPSKIKMTVDAHLVNGGCIVQTQFGSIDSQLEVRVDQAWAAIEARLPRIEKKS